MKQKLLKCSRLLLILLIVFSVCGKLFAQNRPIRGIVLDNNSQPIPGVSITVKGTDKGTTTGVEGQFTLSVDKGQVLVIKSIGFVTQELTVTETYISVQLVAETKALNEIVVTALGVKKSFQKLGCPLTIPDQWR